MPTVLIVDDYPANLVALEAVLEPLHVDIVAARSGVEALQLLSQIDVALILTDNKMDGLSGTELVHRVRDGARNRAVPIVLVSGADADDSSVAEATALPGVTFLQKPYQTERLRARVREAVDGQPAPRV
jgi:CheY-like chemotaxis protein